VRITRQLFFSAHETRSYSRCTSHCQYEIDFRRNLRRRLQCFTRGQLSGRRITSRCYCKFSFPHNKIFMQPYAPGRRQISGRLPNRLFGLACWTKRVPGGQWKTRTLTCLTMMGCMAKDSLPSLTDMLAERQLTGAERTSIR